MCPRDESLLAGSSRFHKLSREIRLTVSSPFYALSACKFIRKYVLLRTDVRFSLVLFLLYHKLWRVAHMLWLMDWWLGVFRHFIHFHSFLYCLMTSFHDTMVPVLISLNSTTYSFMWTFAEPTAETAQPESTVFSLIDIVIKIQWLQQLRPWYEEV